MPLRFFVSYLSPYYNMIVLPYYNSAPAKANRVGYWRLLIPLPRYRRNPIIYRNALVDLHSHRQLLILLDIAEVQACQGGYAGHPLAQGVLVLLELL